MKTSEQNSGPAKPPPLVQGIQSKAEDHRHRRAKIKTSLWSGGEDSALPMQGVQGGSLGREPRSHMPCGQKIKDFFSPKRKKLFSINNRKLKKRTLLGGGEEKIREHRILLGEEAAQMLTVMGKEGFEVKRGNKFILTL